jgi:hypothetical protein
VDELACLFVNQYTNHHNQGFKSSVTGVLAARLKLNDKGIYAVTLGLWGAAGAR